MKRWSEKANRISCLVDQSVKSVHASRQFKKNEEGESGERVPKITMRNEIRLSL